MTRPCARCGGGGFVDPYRYAGDDGDAAAYVGTPCPACAKMPWLPRRYADIWVHYHGTDTDPEWWWNDKPFKPDPSTVMPWCQIHRCGAALGYDMCFGEIREPLWHRSAKYCDIVWIERPTPLEEAT